MADPNRWYEREMDNLERAYEDGEINGAEMNEATKELNRDMQDIAADHAYSAYKDVMDY